MLLLCVLETKRTLKMREKRRDCGFHFQVRWLICVKRRCNLASTRRAACVSAAFSFIHRHIDKSKCLPSVLQAQTKEREKWSSNGKMKDGWMKVKQNEKFMAKLIWIMIPKTQPIQKFAKFLCFYITLFWHQMYLPEEEMQKHSKGQNSLSGKTTWKQLWLFLVRVHSFPSVQPQNNELITESMWHLPGSDNECDAFSRFPVQTDAVSACLT